MARFGIDCQVERWGTCGAEIAELAKEHHAEIEPYDNEFEFSPRVEMYAKLDGIGALTIVTAREIGFLVGYALAAVMPHMHYDFKWASGGGVFVLPAFRKSHLSDRILDLFEDSLRAQNVVLNVVGVLPKHPALGQVLTKRKYALGSLGYFRRL